VSDVPRHRILRSTPAYDDIWLLRTVRKIAEREGATRCKQRLYS
jgi:hypothetical protein